MSISSSVSRPAVVRFAALAAVLTLSGGLAACGSDSGSSKSSTSTTASAPTSASNAAHSGKAEVHDAWTKAANNGMTGVFGMIHNHGDKPVHFVKASTSLGGRTELHETVSAGGSMQMREAADGFRIPVGGELELKPGGNHIMIMDLKTPVTAGQDVKVTLTAEDGSTIEFTAPVRSFEGGNESYQAGTPAASSSMSMPGGAAHAEEGSAHNHG